MMLKWGVPAGLIQVEKAIFPLKRRFDIVVFYKSGNTLLPLLLIECKAKMPSQKAIDQLFGYNTTIQAPFVGLAWDNGVSLFSADAAIIENPSYQMMINTSLLTTSTR